MLEKCQSIHKAHQMASSNENVEQESFVKPRGQVTNLCGLKHKPLWSPDTASRANSFCFPAVGLSVLNAHDGAATLAAHSEAQIE